MCAKNMLCSYLLCNLSFGFHLCLRHAAYTSTVVFHVKIKLYSFHAMLINKMRELLVYKLLVLTTISNLTKIVTAYSVLNKMNIELEQQFSKAPFPEWLAQFTQLQDWPGMDPPYIPLDFIDFSKIPEATHYNQLQCETVPRDICSFDCHKCVATDDILSCDSLTQTFDDGPTPATTDLLGNLNHKATFFTLGINIINYPQIYKAIIQRGHDVASHTWSHAHLPSLSNEKIIAQLQWSIWAMNATGNHIPRYFRPPFGGMDNRVRAIARQFGLQAVLWDRDSFDWQLLTPNPKTEEDILKDVCLWKKHDGRGIILEHDTTKQTTDLAIKIERIIGLSQKTVAQCVGGSNYIRQFQ